MISGSLDTRSDPWRSIKLKGKSIVQVVDQADQIPRPGEVVIETAVSAICGSELHT